MLENIQAVIFDLDGTITDSMWVWDQIDEEFFEKKHIAMPKELKQEIEGMGFTETAEYFVRTYHLTETVEELKESWNQRALELYRSETPLKPGVLEFMCFLKEHRISMGIATSNSHLLLDTFLSARGLTSYINAITTSCDVCRGKPAPDVYLATADKLGTAPEHCLVFEDVPMGILAGRNAGMRVCAVDDAYSAHQISNKKLLADYYITDYRQVLEHTYETLNEESI